MLDIYIQKSHNIMRLNSNFESEAQPSTLCLSIKTFIIQTYLLSRRRMSEEFVFVFNGKSFYFIFFFARELNSIIRVYYICS